MNKLKNKLITIFLLFLPHIAFAFDIEVDGIRYNIISPIDYTAETTESPNIEIQTDGTLVIPNEITYNGRNLKIIKIGDKSFQNQDFEILHLSENVSSIGDLALYNCKALREVVAPNIIDIGKRAFEGCEQLKNLIIGSQFSRLEEYAFSECSNLSDFPVSLNLNYIGSYCFSNSGIKKFQISEKMTIMPYAFEGNKELTEIEFLSMPSNLPMGLFKDCENLVSLNNFIVPEEIPSHFLNNCHNFKIEPILKSPNLKKVGDYAFTNCCFPSDLLILSTVVEIGENAFNGFSGNIQIEECDSPLYINGMSFNNMIITTFNLGRNLSDWNFKFPSSLKEFIVGSMVTEIAPPIKKPDYNHLGYSSYGEEPGGAPFVNCINLEILNIKISDSPLIIAGVGVETKSERTGYKYSGGLYIDSHDTYYSGIFSQCPIRILSLNRSINHISKIRWQSEDGRYRDYYDYYSADPFSDITTVEELHINYKMSNWPVSPKLKILEIGNKISEIPNLDMCDLSFISIKNGVPPTASGFSSKTYISSILTVPQGAGTYYKEAPIWENFWNIEESAALFEIITSIQIPESIELNLEENILLTPIITPENATNKKLQWVSSDEKVVSCSEEGCLEAKGIGTAEILVSTTDGSNLTAKCIVIVKEQTILPDRIMLNIGSIEINIGETYQLEATVLPDNVTDKTIIWSSSNEEVVKVSENGLINAISEGSVMITAACGEVYASCQVTVANPIIEAEQIVLNVEEVALNIGETLQLEPTVLPEDASDKTIIWNSSNEGVAIVSENGLVTAISAGRTIITATCGEVTATCVVTVVNPVIEAEQIVLNIEEAELNIGETLQLEATVLPEDASDKTIIWNSSNENIASVSEEGLVTAISPGEATITATCGEVSAECVITVVEDAGVGSLLANPDSKISVYSVDGVLIKKDCKVEDLKSLAKGIYVIISGKDRYKISI